MAIMRTSLLTAPNSTGVKQLDLGTWIANLAVCLTRRFPTVTGLRMWIVEPTFLQRTHFAPQNQSMDYMPTSSRGARNSTGVKQLDPGTWIANLAVYLMRRFPIVTGQKMSNADTVYPNSTARP